MDLEEQRTITLDVTQGQSDIWNITTTRDYDSLIETTKTLPYLVPLTVWPIPSFRDTLKTSNHVTYIHVLLPAIAQHVGDTDALYAALTLPEVRYKPQKGGTSRLAIPRLFHLLLDRKSVV